MRDPTTASAGAGETCYECGRRHPGDAVELAETFDMPGINFLQRRCWMSTDESELVATARRLLDPKTVVETARKLKLRLGPDGIDATIRAHKVFQAVWDVLRKVLPLAWEESDQGYGWKCGVCARAKRPIPGVNGDQGDAWAKFVQEYVGESEKEDGDEQPV